MIEVGDVMDVELLSFWILLGVGSRSMLRPSLLFMTSFCRLCLCISSFCIEELEIMYKSLYTKKEERLKISLRRNMMRE